VLLVRVFIIIIIIIIIMVCCLSFKYIPLDVPGNNKTLPLHLQCIVYDYSSLSYLYVV